MLEENEIFFNLAISRTLTQNVIDNNNVMFQIEHQILKQEMMIFGWTFDRITSMTINFSRNYGKEWFNLCETSVEIFSYLEY